MSCLVHVSVLHRFSPCCRQCVPKHSQYYVILCMQFIQNQGILLNVTSNNHIEASLHMDLLTFTIFYSITKIHNAVIPFFFNCCPKEEIAHLGLGHREENIV